MKKVIFICLLSLSVCLSKPAEQQAASQNAPLQDSKTTPKQEVPPAQSPSKDGVQVEPQRPSETKPAQPPADTKPEEHKEQAAPSATDKPKPDADNKSNPGKPDAKDKADSKTTIVPPAAASETKNTTEGSATKAPEKATNVTKPDEKKESTTVKPEPSEGKTTEPPKTTQPPPQLARGFDGASFIGGIILTLGLLAIGFLGFKYYKNQTERNYHTL